MKTDHPAEHMDFDDIVNTWAGVVSCEWVKNPKIIWTGFHKILVWETESLSDLAGM